MALTDQPGHMVVFRRRCPLGVGAIGASTPVIHN